MNEPLMRIGKSQMRVLSSRSSEMRLHLNRVGTAANCNGDQSWTLEVYDPKDKTRQSHKVNNLATLPCLMTQESGSFTTC